MPRSSMPGTSITHITTSAITRVCSAHDIARSSAGAGFDGMMVSFLGTFCDAPALRPGGIDAGLRCAPAEPARQIAGHPEARALRDLGEGRLQVLRDRHGHGEVGDVTAAGPTQAVE